MSQFGSAAAGAASGSALGPWGSILGAGIGLAGGLFGARGVKKAQKQAEKENRRRYAQMLDLLRTQGEASKADIRAGAVDERSQATQAAAGRGLYNSSVLDTLQSQANDREARALAGVDRDVTDRVVGVINDRTDAYPDTRSAANAMQVAGQSLPGLIEGVGGLFGKANPAPQAPSYTSAGKAMGLVGGVMPGAAPLMNTAKTLKTGYDAVAPSAYENAQKILGRMTRGWPRPRGGYAGIGL